jgi:hypothetical protein
MKFILSSKKEPKLLSNKNLALLILSISILLTGCQKKAAEEAPVVSRSFINYEPLSKEIDSLLQKDESIILVGNFAGDTTQQAAALVYADKKEGKLSFNLIGIKDNKFEKRYETQPVDGSLKECKVEKISLPGISNDLFYYNSQIYFMGSSDGEVFAYITDFKTQKIYYAHLVMEPRKPVLVYLSDGGNKDIRKFFIDNFKKDYSTIKITMKDPVLN